MFLKRGGEGARTRWEREREIPAHEPPSFSTQKKKNSARKLCAPVPGRVRGRESVAPGGHGLRGGGGDGRPARRGRRRDRGAGGAAGRGGVTGRKEGGFEGRSGFIFLGVRAARGQGRGGGSECVVAQRLGNEKRMNENNKNGPKLSCCLPRFSVQGRQRRAGTPTLSLSIPLSSSIVFGKDFALQSTTHTHTHTTNRTSLVTHARGRARVQERKLNEEGEKG